MARHKARDGDPKAPDGRKIAARVLERVARDGAFAAAALSAELERHPQLDARERALATELSYGALRSQGALRTRLLAHAPRGLKDGLVVSHLLVAAYQILMLDRVPAFAAVDAAVSAISSARGARVAGFAHAVLRKLAAGGERLSMREAVIESTPAWLFARLTSAVGARDAEALIGADAEALPAQALRLLAGREQPPWVLALEPGRVSPLARLLRGEGDPRRRPGYAEGAFVVQEEGAQVIGLALGVQPGERVLDACAGRGQKSSLLAERVGESGELWVSDAFPNKLRALEAEFERLRLRKPRSQALDLSVGHGDLPGALDRVLVDAPCSGIGTLRRRPEIRERLAPEDPARLGELASRILRSAAELARPGGRVVYAVCSVLAEECEGVVERVIDLLEPAPFDAPELSALLAPGATSLRLLPSRHGTDGYFMASFVRRQVS
jgi:16S rRNA (cytosine967-C5)-methyltransferase